ncbi:rhogap domain containing protein, partial [Entamoeba invadens IP1]
KTEKADKSCETPPLTPKKKARKSDNPDKEKIQRAATYALDDKDGYGSPIRTSGSCDLTPDKPKRIEKEKTKESIKASPRKDRKEEKKKEKEKEKEKKKEEKEKKQDELRKSKQLAPSDPKTRTDKKLEKRKSDVSEAKKEKKNIEVTVEIGFLIQNFQKVMKCCSGMTVREVIEKNMLTIKEGMHDDVVVYKSNGEIVLMDDTISSCADGNKAYLYVSKSGRRSAKQITFDVEEKEKEKSKDGKAIDVQTVFNLARWIYIHGIEVEGLFRVNGDQGFVRKKLEKMAKHSEHPTEFLVEMNHGVTDVHNVVGVLKSYLRESCHGIFNLSDADIVLNSEDRASKLNGIITRLTESDKLSLCIMLNLAEAIIELKEYNSMGLSNVAVVFGPMLIHSNGAVSIMGTQCQLEMAVLLINNAQNIRKLLCIDTFFPVEETISKFETPAEFRRSEGEIDRFMYDISCLDKDTQDLAHDIVGWMESLLGGQEKEAIHWVDVFYKENTDHFLYIVNMLTPDFVLEVTESILAQTKDDMKQ